MYIFATTLVIGLVSLLPQLCIATTPTTNTPPKGNLESSAIASKTWLEIVDRSQYSESWDKSSGLMKLTIPKDEWIELMNTTRKPLGGVSSRQVLDQRVAKNPHGLPPGDYMVMYYKTAFSTKPDAKELVTLYSEDGDWRVLTYQIDTAPTKK